MFKMKLNPRRMTDVIIYSIHRLHYNYEDQRVYMVSPLGAPHQNTSSQQSTAKLSRPAKRPISGSNGRFDSGLKWCWTDT